MIGGIINYLIPINFSHIAFILLFITHISSFAIVADRKILKSFVEILLGTLAVIIVQTFSIFLSNFLFGANEKMFLFLNIIVQIAVIILLYKKFLFIFERYRKFIENEYSISILGINCMLVFIIIKILYDNIFLAKKEIFIIIGLFSLFLISAIYLSKKLIKGNEEKKRLEIENQFKPILEKYLEEMRAKEHEYKNHLNALYMMLEVESEKEIKKEIISYINKLKKDGITEKILHVKNTFVKATLYTSICRARELGISIDFSINGSFADIKVDDTELVIILSNLLNNAIEAAEKSLEKEVFLKVYTTSKKDNTTYHIVVENTLNNEYVFDVVKIANKGYSTKGNSRGYGLYNINNIIKNINGKLVIERQTNKISIEAII
ncbi:MAG: sensor histidine kinase [Sarcina sp.]